MVAVTSWFLWWQRRQLVREEEVQPPTRSCQPIRALALNFARAANKPSTTARLNCWKRPLAGQLALNVDAAFLADDNTGACGSIIRDSSGQFIAAATARLEYVTDVESAEAVALAKGLKLAISVGCNSLLVQMVNLIVMESIQQNSGHSMVAAPILDECRSLILDFGKVSLEHFNHESNMVAHALALFGRDDPPNVWLDSPPVFISELLADDVSVV
ncbi:hypothetical protein CFC21_015533 [Triticum aestivum]|uniref:RNase H type-1 domain-containing protein n=2 Tax=Triticum aestivum TaxID=4565 RepID=A0A3B6AU08_WHEAT|nr:hypothetical protein CFC21_015533 [Triticum aestivum]